MSEVKQEQGNLSINSENLFPIIKKWLYSDHDIFFRELISNGCDAVTKVQKLEVMGEYQLQEGEKFRVDVIVNPEEKTLKFIDNGIGILHRLLSPVRQISLRSTRTRPTKIRLSVISVLVSILHSWLQIRLQLIHCPIRKAQNRYSGNVTVTVNTA